MRGEVAVVGTHQLSTEAEKANEPEAKIVFDAVTGALEDAGADRDELSSAIVAGNDALDGRTISNTFTAEAEGGYMKDETKVALDGLHAFNYGCMRILTGIHDLVMVVAYGNHNGITYEEWTNFALDPFRLRETGVDGVHLAAMQARRYYAETDATPDDAARVASANLTNATDNPLAMRAKALSPDDVAAASVRADPLRDPEVAPAGDGAAAAVLAPADRAASYDAEPAHVLGVGHASDALLPGRDAFWQLRAARLAGEAAYERADVRPADVDVAEVTELYAPHQLILAEALGFAEPGHGPDVLDDGPPINPSGGALAGHAYFATGLHRAVEAVRQVTGRADGRQVDDARIALAHGATGAVHQANACALLSSEVDP